MPGINWMIRSIFGIDTKNEFPSNFHTFQRFSLSNDIESLINVRKFSLFVKKKFMIRKKFVESLAEAKFEWSFQTWVAWWEVYGIFTRRKINLANVWVGKWRSINLPRGNKCEGSALDIIKADNCQAKPKRMYVYCLSTFESINVYYMRTFHLIFSPKSLYVINVNLSDCIAHSLGVNYCNFSHRLNHRLVITESMNCFLIEWLEL